jgi:hypothetical protein
MLIAIAHHYNHFLTNEKLFRISEERWSHVVREFPGRHQDFYTGHIVYHPLCVGFACLFCSVHLNDLAVLTQQRLMYVFLDEIKVVA